MLPTKPNHYLWHRYCTHM